MNMRRTPGSQGARAWRRRLACERAIALPTAAMMLMIVLLLAAAAGTAAISASGQSNHDRGTKRAVAAADAGLNTAIYRLNKLEPSSSQLRRRGPAPPPARSGSRDGLVPGGDEPDCGRLDGERDLGDGANYTYEMSAGSNKIVGGQGQQERKIIVTGTANGVSAPRHGEGLLA